MKSIDISQLPKHFDSKGAEEKWSTAWDAGGVYRSPAQPDRAKLFAIDTPPPTVSGSLHIGHVFSYTQTDLLARFRRMSGREVVYPMGWDDNGLPTERRVQNYFHVRCDPHVPYDPDLKLDDNPDRKSPPRQISRSNFIELCLKLTVEDEKVFKALWTRVGLSVDWRLEYSTIDNHCRATAQRSFLDLFDKGHIYSLEAPTMWDVDFQTAVAQAELEDRNVAGHFHDLRFGVEGSSESFTIATTRPELLAACVGVTAHPDDARYKPLFGRNAVTPLFRVPVPIFPSELADPEKGTGILMVCTFGDATDVRWWREQGLALRQILGRNGRILPVNFGDEGWSSLDANAANQRYAQIAGRNAKQARRLIVEMLRDPAGAATGDTAPLVNEPKPIEHSVKFYEKGDQPVEFVTTRQWFVRLLDKKEKLLQFGERIQWHPDFMRHRYKTWTENLAFDWAISRQRYFGVPFPLWYRLDENGQPDYETPIVAPESMYPVDPMVATPPGFDEAQRDKPGGFAAEGDVFDTWFTSSLSPQIVAQWGVNDDLYQRLFPMDVRPQSHEIIRTWAFYTIAKAMLHEDEIPWKHVAISGWILDPDRKKMSKSKGNVVTPMHLLDEYGSDGVRYWASNAQLGSDTAFDVNVLKVGKRLVTKLFNAAKFVLGQPGEPGAITYEMDRIFLERLKQLVERATKAFESYEHEVALAETERFFWTAFTDSFIEMSRGRARGAMGPEAQASAIATLLLGLSVILRLFAPFLPFITEEIWSWGYASETGQASIHRAAWPSAADFDGVAPVEDAALFELAVEALTLVNKGRADAGVSTAREIQTLVVAAPAEQAGRLRRVQDDIRLAARGHSIEIVEGAELSVRAIEFTKEGSAQ